MNLAIFYVWEDARVWAHWNHSFHEHLNYLVPVSCFLHSEFPQGTQWEVAAVVTSLMDEACFAYWSGRCHFSFTHFISDLNWLMVWGGVGGDNPHWPLSSWGWGLDNHKALLVLTFWTSLSMEDLYLILANRPRSNVWRIYRHQLRGVFTRALVCPTSPVSYLVGSTGNLLWSHNIKYL